MLNPFFKNHGPFKISEILKFLYLKLDNLKKDNDIKDIKDLQSSSSSDLTFFHSKKYKDIAKETKASFCLTTEMLKSELPKSCIPIVVDNVLVSTSKITSIFYPNAINDDFDDTVIPIKDSNFKEKVKYGKNVLKPVLFKISNPIKVRSIIIK